MKVKYPVTEAVIAFVFNFPNYIEVIHWIAERQNVCNEEHLREKWEDFADHYSSAEAWLRFYMDCNAEIREAMVDYITQIFAPKCGNFNDDEIAAMSNAKW